MTNMKVIRASEPGACWHDYRMVLYRGFYQIQEKQGDETWAKKEKLLDKREADTALNVWIACHLKPGTEATPRIFGYAD